MITGARLATGRVVGVIVTATLLTFLRPTSWIVALAGFLARGGLIVLIAPIVVVPSLSGLSTAVGPTLERLVLGGADAEAILIAALVFVAATLAIVGLLLIGGSVDGWLVSVAASELGLGSIPSARISAARLAAVRALAQTPLVVAVLLSVGPVVTITYEELIVPGELGTPVALRVLAAIPGPTALLVVAILSDALGALAVRAVALDGATIAGSLPLAIRTALRSPLPALTALVASVVVLLVLVVPPVVAASAAFGGLRQLAADEPGAIVIVGAALLFVACWIGGLLLAGIASAWRSFAWTSVHVRAWAPASGSSPGWSVGSPSGTLPAGR